MEAHRLRDSIAAAEAERRRWARDLHDETLQGLGATKLALSAALRGDPETARRQVEAAVTQLEREIAALRGIIADLRPPALDELGLEAALRTLAERTGALHDLQLDLDLQLGERRVDAEIETIAYRVAQESLTNVVKHAAATRVQLMLRATTSALELSVRDDGRGFDEIAVPGNGGYGITGMRERAEIRGGTLRVEGHGGGGTTVALTVPLR
jgi:signal transduction histidine kinase